MADVPLVGPSYNLDSRPASVQRTINMVPVPLEPGNERTGWTLKDVPGLRPFLTASGDSAFFITPFNLNLEDNISYAAGDATQISAACPLNQWTSVGVRRVGTTVELLCNGIVRASATGYSANVGDASRFYDIGSFDVVQERWIGRIEGVTVREGASTVLELQCPGPNGATSFVDGAGSTLTASGAVVNDNSISFTGSFVANYPAAGNIRSSRACNVGTGDFEVQAIVYPTADVAPGMRILSAQEVFLVNPVFCIRRNVGGLIQGQFRDPSGANLLLLNSSDALSGPLANLGASGSIPVELFPAPTGVPAGMTVGLVWNGITGKTTLTGTPTVAGTYNIVVSYRNSSTLAALGTSTHTVVVAP